MAGATAARRSRQEVSQLLAGITDATCSSKAGGSRGHLAGRYLGSFDAFARRRDDRRFEPQHGAADEETSKDASNAGLELPQVDALLRAARTRHRRRTWSIRRPAGGDFTDSTS